MSKEWLKKLKVGDLVCYKSSSYSEFYTIRKVKKITPTGRIVLENDERFDERGWKYGCDTWHNVYLEEYTEEIKQNNIKLKISSVVNNFKYEKLPYETKLKIYEIIKDIKFE